MTPEGRVKANINAILKEYPFVYSFMPVQFGMGATGVDYHCIAGKYFRFGLSTVMLPIAFFIEAKKPGGDPTARQDLFLRERREKQNCMTFVIDDDPTIMRGEGNIAHLKRWLEEIKVNNERLSTLNLDAGLLSQ